MTLLHTVDSTGVTSPAMAGSAMPRCRQPSALAGSGIARHLAILFICPSF